MSSLISPALTFALNSTSKTREIETVTNLQFNGVLIDLQFKVPTPASGESAYVGKWDFLHDVYLQVMLRLGADNGGSIPLISDVSLYSLLEYSDYIAGVSMGSTQFTPGSTVRISGYLPIGYYSMNSRDALEFTLSVASKDRLPPNTDVYAVCSTVFKQIEQNSFKLYKSSRPTGADQPYKNVLELYYSGEKTVNKQITVTDQIGSKAVNVEDAIALTNAVGNFEFFTRFGNVYVDEFGLSQDLSFRCPLADDGGDSDAEILVVQYGFYPTALTDTDADTNATRSSLIDKIRVNDSEKFDYLQQLGLV